MARPREYDDDLRRRLIDTAAALLGAEGPQAVSTRRVATEVGTSTSAIYALLGSKEELVRAMFVDGFTRLGEYLAAVPPHDDPLEHIAALGVAYLDMAMANPHLYRVMFDCPMPEFQPRPEETLDALSTLQILIDEVDRAGTLGLVPDDPIGVALELWAVSHGIAMISITGMAGSPDQARAHHERLTRAALAGFALEAQASPGAGGKTPGRDRRIRSQPAAR